MDRQTHTIADKAAGYTRKAAGSAGSEPVCANGWMLDDELTAIEEIEEQTIALPDVNFTVSLPWISEATVAASCESVSGRLVKNGPR